MNRGFRVGRGIGGCRCLFGRLGGLGNGGCGIGVGSIGMMGGVWLSVMIEGMIERSEIIKR
jgi:hypothetical protein